MPRRPAARSDVAPADVPTELLVPAPSDLGDEDRWVAVHAAAAIRVADAAHDVELRESLFTGVDLSGRDLRGLRARDIRFDGCDLSGTTLDSATLERVEFSGCRMTGVQLTNAQLRDVVMRECRADLANWRMTAATRLLVTSTSLREADFYEARLTACALLDCDLRAATFRAARLREVDLHGSHLADLRDADGLRGADIAADQLVPLALSLLAANGIGITDSARLSDRRADGRADRRADGRAD